MDELFSKKSIETLITKIDAISLKKMNNEVITPCYLILSYYQVPLNRTYDENISKFCSELKSHITMKHHYPNDRVRRMWKSKIIQYLKYINENIENFKKL